MTDPKNRTSLKQKGRFFKANDPTTRVIDVSDFDLMEICDLPISYPDNPHANVFHSKLHDQVEIDQVISTSKQVNTVFELNDARPVIKPLDFTNEWRRIRKRMTERLTRGDDDDLDYEQEGHTMTLRKKVREAMSKMQQDAAQPESTQDSEAISQVESNIEAQPVAEEPKPVQDEVQEENERKEESTQPEVAPNQPFHFTSEDAEESDGFQEKSIEKEHQFVPMNPQQLGSNQEPPPAQPSEQEIDEAFQEAKAKGYEDGYRLGEEKALLAVQDKIQQTIEEVQNIVQELEGLKSNILHNAQENFQIICQAMMESLVQQQFTLNPATFQQVIQRAIDEAVPDDQFTVHVGPKAFENLKEHADEKFINKLKVDQELKQHDFKIESNMTVVDGNISQIISDLLEEADTNLFDSPEKVSWHENEYYWSKALWS